MSAKIYMLTCELIIWKKNIIIIYVLPTIFMFEATNFVKRVERKIHVQFLDVTADGYSIFKHKHR